MKSYLTLGNGSNTMGALRNNPDRRAVSNRNRLCLRTLIPDRAPRSPSFGRHPLPKICLRPLPAHCAMDWEPAGDFHARSANESTRSNSTYKTSCAVGLGRFALIGFDDHGMCALTWPSLFCHK
jgi:hypothetical protein